MNFPLENVSGWVVMLGGILFGYFLEVSGLGSPRKLNAQFTLRDWTVFKVMFTAIVVAAAALWLLGALGALQFEALKIPTPFFWAMLLGGALLGVGLSVGGYCPGTSVVGLFSGRMDALFFMVGMLVGTLIFTSVFDEIQGLYLAGKGANRQTLGDWSGLPVWLILFGLAGLAWGGFRLGARFESRQQGVISAAELARVTHHSGGAS